MQGKRGRGVPAREQVLYAPRERETRRFLEFYGL